MLGPQILPSVVYSRFPSTCRQASRFRQSTAMAAISAFRPRALIAACLLAMICDCVPIAAAEPFAWQRSYAEVLETGDIRWRPEEFRFIPGTSVRYIDFEHGDDANEGTSPQRPWKHHPWDKNASNNAARPGDADTYVFKGGVIYRGLLSANQNGREGAPIRLTRDPQWGQGPAVLAGSERVSGWTRGADHPKIPEPQSVWRAAIDFAPRSVWIVERDGRSRRIPLARHPNWTSQAEDHKQQWFRWTNDPHPFRPRNGFSANDSKNLKGREKDFVLGALIYSEFGWVMGTPYPTKVRDFDPQDGSVRFDGWTGGGNASIIFRGMRYYLEDKPQYLDDPQGEFWFDKKAAGGVLYLRLPEGTDPNTLAIEAGRHSDLIVADHAAHWEITGLTFRWTSPTWNLDLPAWDTRTKPFGYRPETHPGCIRVWGRGEHLRIANCVFEDVVMPIHMQAVGAGSPICDIAVEDNVFRNTDVGAVHLRDGAGWGFAEPVGVLDDVRIYRNRAENIGFRAFRYQRGCAFDLSHPRRAHIAGNVIERCGAQAINVVSGKSAYRGDVPLVRVLIHQNKAWKTMRNANDFGGIESWQHGPVYIFNNLSFDARGQWESQRTFHGRSPGFGHAYYLDGGFKHYVFNNIAWGLSNDPTSPLVNCSAFQEIISYQNMFFNNTAYNFYTGSRRQAPHAGRNKYLGNVWQSISERVFRHADPAKTAADGNAADAGPPKEQYDFGSNAYANNFFHDIAQMGVFEPSGRWLDRLAQFRDALRQRGTMVWQTGEQAEASILRNPAQGDFRLHPNAPAVDRGAVVFVPWALSGVVAEWNFYPAGDDPKKIIDEHWYAKDYMTDRDHYHLRPTYPLKAVHVAEDDYFVGPLENFVRGSLRFSAAKKTYATASNADLTKPYRVKLATRARHGQDPNYQEFTIAGDDLRTPQIFSSNLLIEIYFKASADGLLISKRDKAGYGVRIVGGQAEFSIAGEGQQASLRSRAGVADDRWHHLIVEADRQKKSLSLYLDGKLDSRSDGLGPVSLANEADLFVGGTPSGEYLEGTIDFLRIARGTLADAQTTIEELYAWQFDGPASRDYRGIKPLGRGRDAGAIETY